MTTSHISLAVLARAAYRPPERPAAEPRAVFEAEVQREVQTASTAVRIELSVAARNALLDLQEMGRSAPSASFASKVASADVAPEAYRPPGGQVNLTV